MRAGAGVSRQTAYARRTREELLDRLGRRCVWCGATEKLQFDHIHGRGYDARELSSSARLARYKREAELGLLRVLCEGCNLRARVRNDNGRHIRTEHASLVPLTGEMPF